MLNHQIERWDESGTSYVWVSVPQLDSSSSSDFTCMYYGNPTAPAPSLASRQATWDASFKLVQHLNETSGPHEDSTSNGNDSTGAVTATTQGSPTGQIGRADVFSSGSLDSFDVANNPTLDVEWASPSLAAQATYADTGLIPELLEIYHLLGDPALSIR